MATALPDIPELFESDYGESILARTRSLALFREIGAPDICHITKTHKTTAKKVGSWNYVTGVDASSSASIAAHLTNVFSSQTEANSFFLKGSSYKISKVIYCCYNAFSKVDIRVELDLPGGVECYFVTNKGIRMDNEITNKMWLETELSSFLRAIEFNDFHLPGLRKYEYMFNTTNEKRILELAEELFWQGQQLGPPSMIQMSNHVHNHLTSILVSYFEESNRMHLLIPLFENLSIANQEVTALLAKACFKSDQQIKSVQLLYKAIKHEGYPPPYTLLIPQIEFLKEQNELIMALQLAKTAVDVAPSEFLPWEKLVEIYIELKDYQTALLALNSAPMFTPYDGDINRMPRPDSVHFPTREAGDKKYIIFEEGQITQAVKDLERLPARTLQGTFRKAYSLLVQITKAVGWDNLLKARSDVFVMEEEYRMAKKEEIAIRQSNMKSGSIGKMSPAAGDERSHSPVSVDSKKSCNASDNNLPLAKKTKQKLSVETSPEDKATTNSVEPLKDPEPSSERSEKTSGGNFHTPEEDSEREEFEDSVSRKSSKNPSPRKHLSPLQNPLELNDDTEDEGDLSISQKVLEDEVIPKKEKDGFIVKESKEDEDNGDDLTDLGLINIESVVKSAIPNALSPEINSQESSPLSALSKNEQNAEEDLHEIEKPENDSLSKMGESPSVKQGSKIEKPLPSTENSPTVLPTKGLETISHNSSENDNIDTSPSFLPTDTRSPTKSKTDDSESQESQEEKKKSANMKILQQKRLCERWLDNLFLLLYEDLRVFTIWQADNSRHIGTPTAYQRSGREWQLLGDLAWRLNHKAEANVAYQCSLEHLFSWHAMARMIEVTSEDKDIELTLELIGKMVVALEASFNYAAYATPVTSSLVKLINEHGLSKVQSYFVSMKLPSRAFTLITKYFEWAEKFKIEGVEL